MSDTFDHEADAWEQYIHDEGGSYSETYSISYDSIITHTKKAILFKHNRVKFWVPKKMIVSKSSKHISVYLSFDVVYLPLIELIDEIQGEDISFSVTKKLEKYLKPISKKKMIFISTPQGNDSLYQKHLDSGSTKTFAEFCGDNLPF